MKTAKVTTQPDGQTVRLPDDMKLDGDEVFVTRVGSSLILIPRGAHHWQSLVASLDLFSKDFMDSRNQPTDQQREAVFP